MPAALIVELISAAVAAAGTGVSVYEAGQQRDAQKSLLQHQQQQQAQQALLQKERSLATAGANAQSQTGGSLTGAAGSSFADILAGYAGLQGSQGSSTSTPQNAVSSSQQNPLDQLLSTLKSAQPQPSSTGDFSGGFTPPQPPPQGRFNLSQLNLG